jgi:hypothetical protein
MVGRGRRPVRLPMLRFQVREGYLTFSHVARSRAHVHAGWALGCRSFGYERRCPMLCKVHPPHRGSANAN